MNTRSYSIAFVLSAVGFLISIPLAHADMVSPSRFIPGTTDAVDLIIIGAGIVAVVLIAWRLLKIIK